MSERTGSTLKRLATLKIFPRFKFERKQPKARLTIAYENPRIPIVPLLKYFVFVGLALAGLLFVFESATSPNRSALASLSNTRVDASVSSRSSIDVLRAMSHHGEIKSTALAFTGPLLPVPIITNVQPTAVVAEAPPAAPLAPVVTSSALDAQARIVPDDRVKQKPAKKKIVAARRPQNFSRYVENVQRGPFEMFDTVQSW